MSSRHTRYRRNRAIPLGHRKKARPGGMGRCSFKGSKQCSVSSDPFDLFLRFRIPVVELPRPVKAELMLAAKRSSAAEPQPKKKKRTANERE